MTTTIEHVRLNSAGEVVERFELPVKPSNETATDIYITDEFLHGLAKRLQKGGSTASNYDNYTKAAWYKPDQGEPVRISSMECKRHETNYEVVFTRPDGKKITKILNV